MPGEGVRVGSAPVGWEVPCISRPTRRKVGVTQVNKSNGRIVRSGESGQSSRKGVAGSGGSGGRGVEDNSGLASMSEDLVRGAMEESMDEDSGEAAGGWVEDLNGLLGFNKGFRGRYVDHRDEHEDE